MSSLLVQTPSSRVPANGYNTYRIVGGVAGRGVVTANALELACTILVSARTLSQRMDWLVQYPLDFSLD